nr:MAG TPA: hypothetical protein [Bacteriophage sp.]
MSHFLHISNGLNSTFPLYQTAEKSSKIKRFKHFIKSLPVYCRVGISPLGGLVDSFSTTLFYHKP